MKRKTTKEILAESFRELAENHRVDKITIQEIVDNCDYSPATFYRHFKDKYDLIAWDYVNQTGAFINKIGHDDYGWKDSLVDGMEYFAKNKEYMQNLLRNTRGHDAVIRYLSEANIDHMTRSLLRMSGQKELDGDMQILVQIYCFGTSQTVCQWLLDEIKTDSDRLVEIFVKALPDELNNILCTQ